jgi:hypothetical protein
VAAAFAVEGLRPPIVVGRCVAEASVRRLAGAVLPTGGFEHDLG